MLVSKSCALCCYSAPLPIHSISSLSASSSHLYTKHCLCLSLACTVWHFIPIAVIIIHMYMCQLWPFPLIDCLFLFSTPFHIHLSQYLYPHSICYAIYFIIEVLKNGSLDFFTITARLNSGMCILVSGKVLKIGFYWQSIACSGVSFNCRGWTNCPVCVQPCTACVQSCFYI